MLANLDAARPVEMAPVLVADLAVEAVFSRHGRAPDREMELPPARGRWRESPVVLGDHPTAHAGPAQPHQQRRRPPPSSAAITVRCRRNATPSGWSSRRRSRTDARRAARVFDRFYRGDSSRHRKCRRRQRPGLSIVSALVAARRDGRRRLGAREGATFWVDLPRSAVATATYQSVSS